MGALLLICAVTVFLGLMTAIVMVPAALMLMPVLLAIGALFPDQIPSAVEHREVETPVDKPGDDRRSRPLLGPRLVEV